jgi:hypothetical protein
MSKLYTKEMFLIAAEKCEVSIIDAKHIMQYIDEYVTPIQLPTDEEIEKFAQQKYHDVEDSRWFEPLQVGAKWMRDKIKGGNNE